MDLLTPRKVIYSDYDVADRDYKWVNTLGAFAYFKFDNLDKSRFPTRGVKGNVNFTWRDAVLDENRLRALHLGSVVFGIEGYIPIVKDRLVLIPQLYGSFLFGKGAVDGVSNGWNPLFEGPVPSYPCLNNILGGVEMGRYIDHQLPFIGLNKISFAFNNLAIMRADLRVRVYKNHYLSAMFNYGRSSVDFKNFFKQRGPLLWEGLYGYNASNWYGAGIRYSLDTKVGPLNFDVSSSNISRNVNLYFSFGYYF
jgi:NTE family protein